MVQLVRDLAVDPTDVPSDDNPFRQVIINTYSPGVVQLCDPDDLLLADVRLTAALDGEATRALSVLPFRRTWRAARGGPAFSMADIVAYLSEPPQAHLRLPSALDGMTARTYSGLFVPEGTSDDPLAAISNAC